MSHDFLFRESEEPLEDEEAGEVYDSLRDGARENVHQSALVPLLAEHISSLWPMPRRGQEDDWPLAAPAEVSGSHVVVSIVPSRLWDVWPTLGRLAEQYELVMYDPQQEHDFLPRRLSRKRTRARARKRRPPDG